MNHIYLEINQILRNESHALRSDHHRVYTEEVNRIVLNINNDKIIQTFDIFTFPYGTNIFEVCESAMQSKNRLSLMKILILVKQKILIILKLKILIILKLKILIIPKLKIRVEISIEISVYRCLCI